MIAFFKHALLSCVLALGATAASAQTAELADYEYYQLGIPVQNTAISGRAAGRATLMRSNILRRNGFLTGLSIDERRDAPCQIRVHFAGNQNPTQTLSECGTSDGSIDADYAGTVGWAEGIFVNAIQVCMNNDRSKVKGIRVEGDFGPCMEDGARYAVVPKPNRLTQYASVPRDGHYLRTCGRTWFDVDTRPNCSGRWETMQRCPNGQVAYGVQVRHTDGRGDRRRIVGLGLHCAPLSRVTN
mmetsp:Transcript_27696/g.51524  ORF Transcript_27696/g.51524 Transcript_27696/m.51524 type:complete len:242 (-) Transcript_27696:138-863(-)